MGIVGIVHEHTYVVCIIGVIRAGWGSYLDTAEGRGKKGLANDMHSPKLKFPEEKRNNKKSSLSKSRCTGTGSVLFRADDGWLGRRGGVSFLNSGYTYSPYTYR